jgi:hypothetical protein
MPLTGRQRVALPARPCGSGELGEAASLLDRSNNNGSARRSSVGAQIPPTRPPSWEASAGVPDRRRPSCLCSRRPTRPVLGQGYSGHHPAAGKPATAAPVSQDGAFRRGASYGAGSAVIAPEKRYRSSRPEAMRSSQLREIGGQVASKTVASAISAFGSDVKKKLVSPAITGAPDWI